MIYFINNEVDPEHLKTKFPKDSLERSIINTLSSSSYKYTYESWNELKFELKLRKRIVIASLELNRSGLNFAVFHKTKCNQEYWNRTRDGGFVTKRNIKSSDAIIDIYLNGPKYGTECATAMMIVYYKALLDIYSENLFNYLFPNITLMNWHKIDPLLREVGKMATRNDYLPGDRRYFKNPDVNPLTPQWQGENVIDIGKGLYYGHGIGIHKADEIISSLNRNRSRTANESAYLLDSAGRPNFKNLENIYAQYHY